MVQLVKMVQSIKMISLVKKLVEQFKKTGQTKSFNYENGLIT